MRVLVAEPGTGATVPGRVVSVSRETASKASISGGLYVAMGEKRDGRCRCPSGTARTSR